MINKLCKIKLIGVKRTEKIKEYEEFMSKIVSQWLEEKDALNKMLEAYALGIPIIMNEDGDIELIRHYYLESENKKNKKN